MINYLQLGRNLRKYAPRVEAKTTTYIYNARGIYDFKKLNPKVEEELTNSFRGVDVPILEISIQKSKHPIGTITIKDGEQELSQDTFVLNTEENIESFLPKTNGCLKKATYDKNEIEEIGEQYGLLKKFLSEMINKLKNPKLDLWLKDRPKYSIGNMVLRDGNKIITRGYFSRTNNLAVPIEKFHFINEQELITGYGIKKDIFCKKFERLPQNLKRRLWIFDERTKNIIKKRYGVGCSPKTPEQIAKECNLTGARIRGILNLSRKEMETANTFNSELNVDLDNLGYLLSEQERYNILKKGSSVDINSAETKIIKHTMKHKHIK